MLKQTEDRRRRFLLALRNNTRLRHGARFLAEFEKAMLLSENSGIRFVELAESFDFQERIKAIKRSERVELGEAGDTIGVERVRELWRRYCETCVGEAVHLWLCRFDDFVLCVPINVLRQIDVVSMVAFDGDTVFVSNALGEHGVLVDRRQDDLGPWTYGVYLWGDARSTVEDRRVLGVD